MPTAYWLPYMARQEGHQLYFFYNFVVSSTGSSTKVRMTTDSSMCTETGLSLNKVTKPAPGVVPSLPGILICSRCKNYFAVYDIKKFLCSVRISEKDSYIRIGCVSFPSFSAAPCSDPTWRFYRDQAIPFRDSASVDYAACAKAATVLAFIKESPIHLQEDIKQAVLKDTYVNDVGSWNRLQRRLNCAPDHDLFSILQKGGFSSKNGSAPVRAEPANTWVDLGLFQWQILS